MMNANHVGVCRVAAALIVLTLAPGARADAIAEALSPAPVIQGEEARLRRQAYDYVHRNANRNVFRRSRQFHPTKNIFRSSRYYQRRLAASTDGYPTHTTVRFDERVDGRVRTREFSWAIPRSQPFGPGPRPGAGGRLFGYVSGEDLVAPVDLAAMRGGARTGRAASGAAVRSRRPVGVSPPTTAVVRRAATQRAVMHQYVDAAGRRHTVIASEPIESSAEATRVVQRSD